MKRKRSNILMGIAGLLLLLAIALAASTLVISNKYPTEQTAVVTFHLPDDFTNVRRILVRTEATKQIITMAGDSKFVEESWSSVGGGLDSLNFLKDWRLELHGTLKVQSLDEYVGKPLVDLTQDVKITPDEVFSKTDQIKPSDRLLDYKMTTRFARDEKEKNTVVELTLTQKILTTAPWFAHRIADRRVYQSAHRAGEPKNGHHQADRREPRQEQLFVVAVVTRKRVRVALASRQCTVSSSAFAALARCQCHPTRSTPSRVSLPFRVEILGELFGRDLRRHAVGRHVGLGRP